MRLLFVTPELSPYSRVTPTGDVAAALPKALRGRGHEITVLTPLYGFIDPTARGLGRRLKKIEAKVDGDTLPFTLYDARTAAGVDLAFVGQEELFSELTQNPLDSNDPANARRYHAFAAAAVDLVRQADDPYDVVQCLDWGAALVPTLLKEAGLEVPTVLTFGDCRDAGRFGSAVEKRLSLEEGFLEAGVRDATKLTTVSPSYAKAIAEPGACALSPQLAERGADVTGIVGGIDVAVWNPATDAHLETRFDPMDLSGKRRCKSALQREVGFPVRDDVPLIAVIGRLERDSGLDVLARVASRALRNDVQICVVAEGGADEELAQVLEEHAERWPDRLAVDADAEVGTVHRTLSAADLVLVEPQLAAGGATQLRAQRYGALPIGPRRGAMRDTVVDCDANLTTGSGFLYDAEPKDGAPDEAVLACLQRAVAAFAKRKSFERLRFVALGGDHGWDRAAYLYDALYGAL